MYFQYIRVNPTAKFPIKGAPTEKSSLLSKMYQNNEENKAKKFRKMLRYNSFLNMDRYNHCFTKKN